MGFQTIDDFQRENPKITIPDGFGDSKLTNGVYIGQLDGGLHLLGRCEQGNQDGVIIKLIEKVQVLNVQIY